MTNSPSRRESMSWKTLITLVGVACVLPLVICAPVPAGAAQQQNCCYMIDDGQCINGEDQQQCEANNGIWESTCVNCEVGLCVTDDESIETTYAQCTIDIGGTFQSTQNTNKNTTGFAEEPSVVLEVPFGSEGTSNKPIIGLSGYIIVVFDYVILLAAIIAVLMIMFAGFKWTTAMGNSSAVGSAKDMIQNAIIGLVLALTSYLLLYTINPALVSMNKLKIPFIRGSSGEGCPAVIKLNEEGRIVLTKPNDIALLKGETNTRGGAGSWCYSGANGGCSGPPPDANGEVTINPSICNAIVAAADALPNAKIVIGSIVGTHSRCVGGGSCTNNCAGCNRESAHWSGRAVDISFSGISCPDIEVMNTAISKVAGLSQIISQPCGVFYSGPYAVQVGGHDDHTHVGAAPGATADTGDGN